MFNRLRARSTLQRLCRNWMEYRGVVREAVRRGTSDDAQEERFLLLEAEIAGLTQTLAEQLPGATDELRRELAAVTGFLKHHRSLGVVGVLEPAEREAFEDAWHEHYIFLSQLRGARLRGAATRPRPSAPAPVPTGFSRHPRWQNRRGSRGARLLRFAIQAGLFVLAIHLAGRALGLRWSAAGQFALQTPDSLNTALGNVTGAVTALWAGLISPLQPVLDSYGSLTGGMMLGALALALLYWVFVRN